MNYDIDNTVFSYIPNTAETAYLGLMEGVREQIKLRQCEQVLAEQAKGEVGRERFLEIMRHEPRFE